MSVRNLDLTRAENQHARYENRLFRLPATLLMSGFLLFVIMTFLHPGGPANDHRVIFAEYAASDSWHALHIGQFAGIALLMAGLLALYRALHIPEGRGAWAARLGAVCAATTLGLYGVLQAVDGVALKHAVDAWVSAPEGEAEARFATAEAVRWIEWGARSYQTFTLGLALILLGAAIVVSARLPKALGFLMGLSGLTYLVQGWVLGSSGFSDANTLSILAGYVLILAWLAWLAYLSWRPQRVKANA